MSKGGKTNKPKNKSSQNNKALTKALDAVTSVKAVVVGNPKTHRYPDATKILAIALYAQGHSMGEICSMTDVPSKHTIHRWIHDSAEMETKTQELGYEELVEQCKSRLSSKLTLLASRTLSSVTDEDLEKASLLQKATASAIFIDKSRLMENKSTENIALMYGKSDEMTDDIGETSKEIEALSNEIDSMEV
jgi:transposase-like protein|tara:strand:+ start:1781 stop:2353 length:573 start_codon:yes stop_codon:yes gene_type:complete